MREDSPSLRLPRDLPTAEPMIVGTSPAMQDVLTLARRVAAGDAKVLITGESGVGKDLIARYIHAQSGRARGRFVAVNCAALTETLLESELFGHARGSFTGAYRDKVGKLELADRGTIFLDEVGEMSVRMQVLLLRFLENGEIQAVGSDTASVRVDARVIAATNRNLQELVSSGAFRGDLLYRIQVGHIHVPPLRDHADDVRPLVEHTIARTGRQVRFTDAALAALEAYRWPGNVRELQNIVEQLVWMAGTELIDISHLREAVPGITGRAALPVRERRRQLADDLYAGLVSGSFSFWDQIYGMFLSRDITRHEIRQLLRKGLATTYGNYRALIKLFRMEDGDYKRFLNFLAAHDCNVDARIYRRRGADDRADADPAKARLDAAIPAPTPARARSLSERPT